MALVLRSFRVFKFVRGAFLTTRWISAVGPVRQRVTAEAAAVSLRDTFFSLLARVPPGQAEDVRALLQLRVGVYVLITCV